MAAAISAKILFENQLRKVQLTAGPSSSAISWAQLTSRLEDLFKFPSSFKTFQLTYTDDDGDTIVIDSDRPVLELSDVVTFSKRDGQTSLRFNLSIGNSPVLGVKNASLVAPGAEQLSDDSDVDPDFVLVSPPSSPRSSSEPSQFEPESPIERRDEISEIHSRSIGTAYPAFQNEALAIVKETEEFNSEDSPSTVTPAAVVETPSDGDAADVFPISDIPEIEPTLLVVPSVQPSEEAVQDSQVDDDKPSQIDLISFTDESVAEVEQVATEDKSQVETDGLATQLSQPEAREQARQQPVYEDLDSFIADTQPLINNIIERLESNPHFISGLLSRFESQLSGSNWGIAVLPPQALHLSSSSATQWGMADIHPQPSTPTEQVRSRALNRLLGVNKPTTVPTTNWSGVICDVCNKVSFSGARYKCAECYDFDMCGQCHDDGAFHQHTTFDAVRSINDVWRNIECDGCGVRSLFGKRYKCAVCRDYDLCSRCFGSGKIEHEASHGFVALEKVARAVEATQSSAPSAEPVAPTTAASSSQVSAPAPSTFEVPISRVSSVGAPPPLPPYPGTANVSDVRMPGNFPSEPVAPHPPTEQNQRSRRAPENRTYANVFEDALVSHNLRECREMLASMGYSGLIDDDVLVPLLERHDGDVGDVVRYLLDEGLIA
ncbi:hypothetical protein BJ742DRAFT_771123 [Cladochytrium replicatum]|nr:hypothetical protein BJ742DRAFT_771123 [Cladochytrium replicatum]